MGFGLSIKYQRRTTLEKTEKKENLQSILEDSKILGEKASNVVERNSYPIEKEDSYKKV